jgi:ubiquinone/menaquinone biosynthesis C-methylase UbiE
VKIRMRLHLFAEIRMTHLEMYFVDIEAGKLLAAKEASGCVDNILHFTEADLTALPFADDFADLIISRGFLWFWKDRGKGLREIYRVLKQRGIAPAGGGMGRYTPKFMRMRLKGKPRRALQLKGEPWVLEGEGAREAY